MNIITLDQEEHRIVAVTNGAEIASFDPAVGVFTLPTGGGIIVADGNTWAVRNEKSQSQFCWGTQEERDWFQDACRVRGYKLITIANKQARTVMYQYGLDQSQAVRALYLYVREQVDRTGSFDSGHEVRPSRGDISYGERARVTNDFLVLQNAGGYASPFMEDIVAIAFAALDKDDRPIFDLRKTKPKVGSPRRLAAVAAAVYDPFTGQLRTHNDQPWGIRFIVRNVIGLNGTMRGTGERAPGNPMRAALRKVGKLCGPKIDREDRARTDFLVRELIRAFRKHPVIRPVRTEDSILPVVTAEAAAA